MGDAYCANEISCISGTAKGDVICAGISACFMLLVSGNDVTVLCTEESCVNMKIHDKASVGCCGDGW